MPLNKLGTECIYTLKHLSFAVGVPVSVLELLSSSAPTHYHPFKKVRSGKERLIANPTHPMKAVQRKIVKSLLNPVTLPDEIYGARKGRDIKQNASLHVRKRVLVTVDIKDCFPSVSHTRVFRLFREKFMYSEKVSNILTNLTTYRGSLPQGGATSAMILNILLIPLCKTIKGLKSKFGYKLSFWVDDIAISGDKAHLLCQPIIRELQKFGFRTRSKKVRVMFSHRGKQILTGLITNSKISVPKEKIQQYLSDAVGKQSGEATLAGRLNFVKSINPNQEKRIRRRIISHK